MTTGPTCPKCQYDLSATAKSMCPECGTEFRLRAFATIPTRPSGRARVAALAAAIVALAFVFATISNGSIQFWWSPFSAIIVWVCTPLLLIAAIGPGSVVRAFHCVLTPTSDSVANAEAAAAFRLAGGISLMMGALGVTVGFSGCFAFLATRDLGAIGHSIAVTLMCQLYALLLAIPAFIASASLFQRTDLSTQLMHDATRTRTLGIAASVASTLAASLAFGIVVWAMQR